MNRDEVHSDDDSRPDSDEDVTVANLIDAFLAECQAGRAPDPQRLLADHPKLVDRLRAGLEVLRLAEQLADGLSPATDPRAATAARPANGQSRSVVLREPVGEAQPPIDPHSAEMQALGEAGNPSRYQLQGEIGGGGMGTILKGRDLDIGRDVAVKVLLAAYKDNPVVVSRFVEEAQIGGQLQHPGIVPIYELGVFPDRRPFFAMKLICGRTLAELLAERPTPAAELPRFLAIFEQVCQTMAYAHARGVIHRDLKPSNVMVGSFGEVQVMDWGLAKVLPREAAPADDGS